MKLVLFLLAIPTATAFSSPAFVARNPASCLLNMVKTGPQGKPAKTSQEDLELTRQVIHEFLGDDEAPAKGDAPKAAAAPDEEGA
jgi:hypothetical protein